MQQLWVLMLQTAYFLSHLKESLMGRQSLFIRQSDLNIVHIGPDSDTNPLNFTDEAFFMRLKSDQVRYRLRLFLLKAG